MPAVKLKRGLISTKFAKPLIGARPFLVRHESGRQGPGHVQPVWNLFAHCIAKVVPDYLSGDIQ